MALGSARQQFTEAATPSSAEDVGAGLLFLSQMLADPKRVSALADKAAAAQKVIDQAAKATADLEARQHKADADLAAVKSEIVRLRAEHERSVRASLADIEASRAALKKAHEDAAVDREKAAELLAEQRRRLAAVEKAIAGA